MPQYDGKNDLDKSFEKYHRKAARFIFFDLRIGR
jgi:hypothetical protein